jgi:hypothetical protein
MPFWRLVLAEKCPKIEILGPKFNGTPPSMAAANMCPRNSPHKISNITECIVTKKYLFFVTKSPNITDENGKFDL